MKTDRQKSTCKHASYTTKETEITNHLGDIRQQRHNVPRNEKINAFASDGERKEIAPKNSVPSNGIKKAYFRSKNLVWYWTTLAITFATMLATLIIHENAFPATYVRWVLGFVFVVFLPGYSLVRSLQVQRSLNNLESFCLSIGISLALVAIFGLLLDQTPWGINLTTVTFGLLATTITFSTVAVIRDFRDSTWF